MGLDNLKSEITQAVDINWGDRWPVYQRLQELQIPCQCFPNQPLQVQLDCPTAAIQVWSVVKQLTSSRNELVHWLDSCW
ncbi:MAG: Asr1405/Asl0597 family protein [Microcystaceae cyanobacterium]